MKYPRIDFFVKLFYTFAILYIYLFVVFDILKLNPENDGDLAISAFFPHVIASVIFSIIYIIFNKSPNNYTWTKNLVGSIVFIFLLLIIFSPLIFIFGNSLFLFIRGESNLFSPAFQFSSFGLLSLLPFLHFLLYKYTFKNIFFFVVSFVLLCGTAINTYPIANYLETKKSSNPCATKRLILNHYTLPYERQEIYNGVVCVNEKRSYSSHTFRWVPLRHSDVNSFKYLGAGYSRDKNHVFYEGKIIEADPKTFTINAKWKTEKMSNQIRGKTSYKKDSYNVYHKGKKLPVSDISNFKIIDLCHSYKCATDGMVVFKDGEIVQNLNYKKIQSLHSCGYAKDNINVYHSTNIIPGADANTFTVYGKMKPVMLMIN